MRRRWRFHRGHALLVLCFLLSAFLTYWLVLLGRPWGKVPWGRYGAHLLLVWVVVVLGGYVLQLWPSRQDPRNGGVGLWLGLLFRILAVQGGAVLADFFLLHPAGRLGRLIHLLLFLQLALFLACRLWRMGTDHPVPALLWLAGPKRMKTVESAYPLIRPFDWEQRPRPGVVYHTAVYPGGGLSPEVQEILIRQKLQGCRVLDVAEFIEEETSRIPLDWVDGDWLLSRIGRTDRVYRGLSRLWNMAVAVPALLLLGPAALVMALVHKACVPGPLFFRQERVGWDGRVFALLKFRSLPVRDRAEETDFVRPGDPRLHVLGRWMRRLRLDEVPQLWQVLTGQMNLVGPRPERPGLARIFSREIPFYPMRWLIPPGLTGWAQVTGGYAGEDLMDHRTKMEHDLYYLKNRCFSLDLVILARTLRTILSAGGR